LLYLKNSLNIREQARVKMELADIMVYDEKFNQAILYYAQVEDNLKNDVLAHEASLKLAKANFYKKDFDWTLQQVKVLKQSPSLLIANDAIEMFKHPLLSLEDNREHYGEERWLGIGWIKNMMGVVIYTERTGDVIRIISARKATKKEVSYYEQYSH
jgi:uncharacterized DUF497 family protein